jgi:hypothetical protein
MSFFYLVRGNWLWFVWAAIAVCVVVGYIRVRHHLHRVEASGDAASAEARKRHAAEHAKRKRGGVE